MCFLITPIDVQSFVFSNIKFPKIYLHKKKQNKAKKQQQQKTFVKT